MYIESINQSINIMIVIFISWTIIIIMLSIMGQYATIVHAYDFFPVKETAIKKLLSLT